MAEQPSFFVDGETGEVMDAPDWLETLRELTGWEKVTLEQEAKLLAYVAGKGYTEDECEEAADAMLSKDGNLKYTRLDAAFRNWVRNTAHRRIGTSDSAPPPRPRFQPPAQRGGPKTAAQYLRQMQQG
jgi:hypothetical protein